MSMYSVLAALTRGHNTSRMIPLCKSICNSYKSCKQGTVGDARNAFCQKALHRWFEYVKLHLYGHVDEVGVQQPREQTFPRKSGVEAIEYAWATGKKSATELFPRPLQLVWWLQVGVELEEQRGVSFGNLSDIILLLFPWDAFTLNHPKVDTNTVHMHVACLSPRRQRKIHQKDMTQINGHPDVPKRILMVVCTFLGKCWLHHFQIVQDWLDFHSSLVAAWPSLTFNIIQHSYAFNHLIPWRTLLGQQVVTTST